MRSQDTDVKAERVQLDIFRRMSPEKRLQTAIELSRTSRRLLAEGVRRRHPAYGEDQTQLAVIRLLLSEDLFLMAYPEAREIQP